MRTKQNLHTYTVNEQTNISLIRYSDAYQSVWEHGSLSSHFIEATYILILIRSF